MIERVVRMTFQEDKTEEFLQLFTNTRNKIRSFPGCCHLELWKDPADPRVFITFSKWEKPSDLENYRNSDLFADTWAKTKAMFEEKPVAFSGEVVTVVGGG